jgi:anti-sigma-K factor RskA
MSAEEIDALASEYVLGTLDANERRAADARIASEPEFRAAVAGWEKRLQPLADAEPPVAPSAGAFAAILARIAAEPPLALAANVVKLRRQLRRWRLGASFTGIAAAALLAVAIGDWTRPPETRFVAMLTPSGGAPAFVLTVDTVSNTLSIRRVAGAAPAGKSYELWAVEPGQNPKSLGVVEQARYTRPLAVPTKDLVLAVSLEPQGGSPTGAPTGPVVFSGPLIKSN